MNEFKSKKLAVIGYGARGSIYANFALKYPELFELIAVCEVDETRRNAAAQKGIRVFDDYRKLLDSGLDLDLVAISTQDADHKEHAIYAMQRGYDLLLEKPIAPNLSDCIEIRDCASRLNRRVFVCHVLRYSKFYGTIKDIIDEGVLGDVINIHALEAVGYYHIAHSFVRGPWRNKEESSPMILAKCCHDMDIIRYLMGKKCVSISSYGERSFFRKENAPENSADFCSQCALKDSCIWNAQKLYTTDKFSWAAGYFVKHGDTKEDVLRDLKGSQYDRCVFKCDNNVVDHQSTAFIFEDGKTAVHTMTGFSKEIYRDIKVFGTKAELYGNMEDNYIEIRPFAGDVRKINVDISGATVGGHNGSDFFMMQQIFKTLNGETAKGITYLDVSLESHIMAFAAEESRLQGGKNVRIDNLLAER